ncbi:sigma-E processing peptidase SpoIIGA [Lederbergia citrea]|uniref:Sporulation sigma-E factor-processing peptidase n=1 Tax=Lederbergia citrea TaxID=2833581 RepID=A0A942Z496_9BACI|nr:sigma-E processing peptidase SpoIIGA [Lederbergia citrea]MBS4177201.1 sigma-E processing peptidase SpoIIGA [Lederbergia citrea]MBS4203864.1 sigma-E processing peptidase SpoIIGA [Lederbergia citrea]MBS4221551.1 sigma-E processing peptidase SpoIIGA [Lederbergia citrea]
MVVYLDIIWLLNLLVDSLLLWTTSIYLKRSTHPIRLFLGGFLGSLLIILAVTPYSTIASQPLAKAIISIGMVLTAFGFKKLSYFFSGLFTFYFATFLMGGILLGTHYFLTFDLELRSTVLLESVRGYGDPISWLFLIGAFPVAWHFSKRRIDGITISNIQYEVLTDVTIKINGSVFQLKGLIDSGNQLYDPISKTPVMIVSVHTIKDLLPKEVLLLTEDKNDTYEVVAALPSKWSSALRLIPAKTLGRNNQLLCAFKPDFIALRDGNGKENEKKAFVVFTDQILSSDGSFHCIIHPHMASGSITQSAS